MEYLATTNLENDSFSVTANFVTFSQAADQLAQVLCFEHHNSVIDIRDDFATGKLKYFRRIQGNQVIDILGHDQHIFWCASLGRARHG